MTTAAALKETSPREDMPAPLEGTVMSSQTPPPPLAGTATAPMLQAGDVLGSYEVTGLLGRGGMGEVYAATHTRLGRKAALKVLRTVHASRADLVERFFQEARTVNAINHEHIVEVYDFVEERVEGQPARVYLVMELLSGTSLSEAMQKAPLPLRTVVRVARQVAQALAAAHRVGVVHRDVKPDNVFLAQRNGQSDYVKVLDFGVAKLEQRPAGVTPETLEGMIIGTPAYMSPEQASAVGTDARSDIYSLGTLLYELLCGKLPFDAQSFVQLAMQVVATPVPPLPERSVSGEEIPTALRDLVMACLSKEPAHRPAGMDAVAALLDGIGEGLEGAVPGRVLPPRSSPKRGLLWAGAALGLAGVFGLGAWTVLGAATRSDLPDAQPVVAPAVQVQVQDPDEAQAVPPPFVPPIPTPLLLEPQPETTTTAAATATADESESAKTVPARARVRRVPDPKPRELSKDALLDPYAD